MEDHADRHRRLDRNVRVRTLAAGLAAGLYWLRFGYFIAGGSGLGASPYNET